MCLLRLLFKLLPWYKRLAAVAVAFSFIAARSIATFAGKQVWRSNHEVDSLTVQCHSMRRAARQQPFFS